MDLGVATESTHAKLVSDYTGIGPHQNQEPTHPIDSLLYSQAVSYEDYWSYLAWVANNSGTLGNDSYFDEEYLDYSYVMMEEYLNDEKHLLPSPLPLVVQIIFIVLFTIVILLSVSGNSLVILVVAKHKKMRTVTNAFLVSLAVSDLLIAVVNMPIQLAWYLHNEWTLGEHMCKFTRYFQGVVIVASILTLTGIALDRYYAICHPLRARHVHTLTRAAILIFVFWIVAFVMVIPQIIIQRLEPLIDKYGPNGFEIRLANVCREYIVQRYWEVTYTFYFYLLLYVGPLVVMLVTYGRISYKLWNREPIGETTKNSQDSERRLKEKKRIVRMLVVIVILFALCWFPFFTCHVYTLFVEHSPHDQTFMIVLALFQILGYCNSCINPIVYCFMNESFKKHFYKTICCCKCFWRQWRNRRRSSSTEMNGLNPMISTYITNNSTLRSDKY